jgi:tRNA-intron endonuclease, archaea type
MNKDKFQIYFIGDKLFSNSDRAFSIEANKKLGEKKENKIFYSDFEAMFLSESKKTDIVKSDKKLSEEDCLKYFSKKDRDFYKKYLVFKKLRERGYVVKTGSKFGSEFRVYNKNAPLNSHAKWLVFPVTDLRIDVEVLIAKTRISHSTGKKLLIAIVDKEDGVSFYEIDWLKI